MQESTQSTPALTEIWIPRSHSWPLHVECLSHLFNTTRRNNNLPQVATHENAAILACQEVERCYKTGRIEFNIEPIGPGVTVVISSVKGPICTASQIFEAIGRMSPQFWPVIQNPSSRFFGIGVYGTFFKKYVCFVLLEHNDSLTYEADG